jgi:hypothetical protein
MIHGEGVRITKEMIPDVAKQPKVMAAAVEAGKRLGERLNNGHDRTAVTGKMQEKMMAMFKSSA